ASRALSGSGLAPSLPSLAAQVARRPFVKDVHLLTALAWILALAAVVVIGDRRGLRATTRELDFFDADDRRCLLAKDAPQGRFNAGQKLNAALTAAFAVIFLVSGALLWLGE